MYRVRFSGNDDVPLTVEYDRHNYGGDVDWYEVKDSDIILKALELVRDVDADASNMRYIKGKDLEELRVFASKTYWAKAIDKMVSSHQ